jgi:hypothetical protein
MALILRWRRLFHPIFFLSIKGLVVVTIYSQGCPISPLCFSLYIDDMTDVLEFSKFHMYADADDLQIYHSWPRDLLSECIREVLC